MRNKMIELLFEIIAVKPAETLNDIADFLLANGVTLQQWIPVSEMPNEACEIIVTDGRRTEVVDFSPIGTKSKPFGESPRLVCNFVDGTTMYPTHWMPRPELPKEEV